MVSKIEKAVYIAVVIIIAVGAYLAQFHHDIFRYNYIMEDGPLESGTAILFFIAGVIMLTRAIKLRKKRSKLFLAVTVMAGLLMFFGAGEEISWGQRIFGIETPETFAKHNKQGETNLHNLKFGDVSINKLVFSKLLAVCLVIYLLVLPILASKKEGVRRFTEKLAIPLPSKLQIIMWFVALALPELLVNSSKKGEVREVCAGLMVFVTLLTPRNKYIYDPARDDPHNDGEAAS